MKLSRKQGRLRFNSLLLFALLSLFFVSGCSKIIYEPDCAPKLRYVFSDSLPFSVMNISDKGLMDKIKESGEIAKIGIIPMVGLHIHSISFNESILIDTESTYIALLGPVIRYQSHKYAITREDSLYFYVHFQGHQFWIPDYQLDFFVTYYPTEININNQEQLMALKLNRFNSEFLPECMRK
ncbi:hypothetical protein [uncultured Shewanella sp.]|uniref:hypothetical protein n=1 Tax=uncultured Shewanella sp. TaxID=173975 RepID=UPI0026156C76|nr:hypothetical protein [uncultured Shewanella sp.]